MEKRVRVTILAAEFWIRWSLEIWRLLHISRWQVMNAWIRVSVDFSSRRLRMRPILEKAKEAERHKLLLYTSILRSFPGGPLEWQEGVWLVHGHTKSTLITYFSGMKIGFSLLVRRSAYPKVRYSENEIRSASPNTYFSYTTGSASPNIKLGPLIRK